jgi:hypothetical protein
LKADLEVEQKALSIRINSDAVFDQQAGIFKAM